MDSAEQAQAFAALEAIQAGRWDRVLHRFAGVVKMRELTEAYQASLIVGENFCPHGEPWSDRDPCPDMGAPTHKFTDSEWLAWPRPPKNGGWCQVKGCGLAESDPVHTPAAQTCKWEFMCKTHGRPQGASCETCPRSTAPTHEFVQHPQNSEWAGCIRDVADPFHERGVRDCRKTASDPIHAKAATDARAAEAFRQYQQEAVTEADRRSRAKTARPALPKHVFVPVKGGPVRNGICFAEGCGRGEFDSVHAVAVETHKYVGGSWPGAKCEWAESAGCSWYPCELPANDAVHGGAT